MRGPFSIVLRVAFCLIIGLLASGLSAWSWKLIRDRTWLWRTAAAHPWLLACLHRAHSPPHASWHRNPPFEHAPASWSRITGLGYRNDFATWGDAGKTNTTALEIEQWGLPLPCLEMSAHGYLGSSIPTREDSWESKRFETRFPKRPLWTGVAIDTLFFGAATWWLISLALAYRRRRQHRRRRRAGKCEICTYDRKGLPSGAVCPECGAPAPRERRK
jgi:hypothetical protein